ncbi:hypothetical protein ACFVHQ_03250 [Actinomycetes bacterium NPDC127524]|uniref:hypothetical protein n=1 Tax=unclassified Bacillus (in: firmicutes) TaxID=185979 RepID=UPI0008E50EBE|nr:MULTISPECIES: hypothetical protein [unclassified Bacillus (in: firmicutes)]SFC39456.1 hypothetical protein SAMN05443252_103205 [Bacillus sp. OV322]
MKLLIKIIAIGSLIYLGFQNRYRLLNVFLSNSFLRRFLVSSSLNMPGMREKMMQNMFGRTK